jgi:hypothetical protein
VGELVDHLGGRGEVNLFEQRQLPGAQLLSRVDELVDAKRSREVVGDGVDRVQGGVGVLEDELHLAAVALQDRAAVSS